MGSEMCIRDRGWQALSFQNNRQWLATLREQLTELQQSPDRAGLLASGQGLELLREQLSAIEQNRAKGVPLQLGAGLYRGDDIYRVAQAAYLQQLRTQALEPVTLQLQLQMRAFNEFAKTMEPQNSFASASSKADAAKGRAQGLKLPTRLNGLPRSSGEAASRLSGAAKGAANKARGEALAALRNPATASDAADLSATTGGLSLSEEMLGRLDERQVASIIESYNALKLYLMLTQPGTHPDPEFVGAALPVAWANTASADNPVSTAVIQDNSPVLSLIHI